MGEWTQHHPHLIPICKSEKSRTLLSCRACKLFDELITETLMLRFIWAHASAQAGQKLLFHRPGARDLEEEPNQIV